MWLAHFNILEETVRGESDDDGLCGRGFPVQSMHDVDILIAVMSTKSFGLT